jgi:hypothetical protein
VGSATKGGGECAPIKEAGAVALELQCRPIPRKSQARLCSGESGQVGACVRVHCACERAPRLENRRPRKGIVGSNPTLSASSYMYIKYWSN